MARNPDNAQAQVDGFAFVAVKGSTLPTDTTTALDAVFKDLGWLTDAGIGETPSTDTTTKRGINGAPIKVIRTSDDRSFTIECYEKTAITMGLIRPGSTPATAGGVTTTHVKSFLGSDVRAFVLEQDMGTYTRRVAIAQGQAFQTGPIQDKPGDLSVIQLRIDCFPASDGTTYIDLTDNAAEAV